MKTDTSRPAHYNLNYENFRAGLYAEIRREAFGDRRGYFADLAHQAFFHVGDELSQIAFGHQLSRLALVTAARSSASPGP